MKAKTLRVAPLLLSLLAVACDRPPAASPAAGMPQDAGSPAAAMPSAPQPSSPSAGTPAERPGDSGKGN